MNDDYKLVQSQEDFDKFKDVGDPTSTAKIFNDSDADELILLKNNLNDFKTYEFSFSDKIYNGFKENT